MRETAHAKLNLFLRVLGRRPDGYHLLDSLAVFAAIHDVVEVRPAAEFALRVAGPFAPALRDLESSGNLAFCAARGLMAAAGADTALDVRLEKNLPVAAGLGGGSADAAAVLRAGAALGVNVGKDALGALALELGADVPVCLESRPSRMVGVGEVLEPVEAAPAFDIVLACPPVPLATRTVFESTAAADKERAAASPRGGRAAWLAWLRGLGNDLTPAAIEAAPAVGTALKALENGPHCELARMSGSGPACFGLFAGAGHAAAAAADIAERHSDWWVVATQTYGSAA